MFESCRAHQKIKGLLIIQRSLFFCSDVTACVQAVESPALPPLLRNLGYLRRPSRPSTENHGQKSCLKVAMPRLVLQYLGPPAP